jgi:hypothetical protein
MRADIKCFGRRSISFWLVVKGLISILAFWLAVACGTQTPEEPTVQVRFRDTTVDPTAVSVALSLVAPSHRPDKEHLPTVYQPLFTYLAQTDPASLVTTKPHSQGTWRIEKVFLLDDCVAVQMTEGHYLETLFFIQYSEGWRLKARIRPHDHE